MTKMSLYVTPKAVPYVPLSISGAFKELSQKQRLYAHHMMMAGWCGAPVVAQQLSPESLPLLRLFFNIFSANSLDQFRASASATGISAEDVASFMDYAALVYANMGNYLSFGDSKFVPSCSKEAFKNIVKMAAAEVDAALLERVYDLSEPSLTLDFPPKGVTSYYSENITREDATLANEYLAANDMEGVNTRVWKEADGSLTIRVAAAEEKKCPPTTFKGTTITLHYGDFQQEMRRVVEELAHARKYAENETQQRMLDHYIAHFMHGDVKEHKESQKEWVKDVGPVVESNIGFIESYRDPSGVRSEWEGFVAVVNKDQSRKYGALVAGAEKFIKKLPWGEAFEKDTFTSPDFTSLDVLGFASSGIPAGICIPNYDDIRQDHGFKNVYLSNVVSAINFADKLTHLTDSDWEIYKKSFVDAMSVNVGIHELLGHGTGKLFMEKPDGSFNFDRSVVDPISGKPVATWYKPGETFGSVFGGIGSSYEECRAEAVALYLCVQPELLEVFQLRTKAEQDDAIYICWLNMVRAGLVGLEFYTPETKQWRQAHMRARYCILQALVRDKDPLVKISTDEKDGIIITIDRSRIVTDGVKAMGNLLVNLSVNKSLANAQRGTDYYTDLTTVDSVYAGYRDIIMAKRKPRKQYVQPHTSLNGEEVSLAEFDGSVDGIIASMVARHKQVPL